MTTLIAFHGDAAVKEALLAQLRAHRAADEIVQGVYWQNGKGCAVGCCTHKPDGGHALFPKLWGIPEEIALLMDGLFEELPVAEAKDWPILIIDAIPVGADLSLVIPRFLLWLLADSEHGTFRLCDEQGRAATETVAALLRRRIDGDEPTEEEWAAAWSAAWDAAWDADRRAQADELVRLCETAPVVEPAK